MQRPFMRSKLFVPGARAALFDKALRSAADAVSFDLEDAVAQEAKAQARLLVGAALREAPARALRSLLIVRVNAPDTPAFEADLKAVVQPGLAFINLPKVQSAADVLRAVSTLERVESENGVTRPIELLVTIETPRALLRAFEIASAHPRVTGLQLGLGDLFEPLAIDRRDAANLHAAMFALRLAAGAAGVFACDGAYAELQDLPGFRAEAEMAQRLGFIGKSCIHLSQVATANEVFGHPNHSNDLAAALRIVEAARAARGQAVFVVDGKMIDAPYLQRAQAVVAPQRAAAPGHRACPAERHQPAADLLRRHRLWRNGADA